MFITIISTFIAIDAKTKKQILNRCKLLSHIKIATLKNLQKLEQEAHDGDISSALALYEIFEMEKDGRGFYHSSNEVFKKLRAINYINELGKVYSTIRESFSEEVYEECKAIFEEDEERNKTIEYLLNNPIR